MNVKSLLASLAICTFPLVAVAIPDDHDDRNPKWSASEIDQIQLNINFADSWGEGVEFACKAASVNALFIDIEYKLDTPPQSIVDLLSKALTACPEYRQSFYDGFFRLDLGIIRGEISKEYWEQVAIPEIFVNPLREAQIVEYKAYTKYLRARDAVSELEAQDAAKRYPTGARNYYK